MISRLLAGLGTAGHFANRHAYAALFVCLFVIRHLVVPVFAAGNGLDASWQLVLHHAHARELSFGNELSFTYGPAGYLLSSYYFNDTFASQLVYQTTLHALGAILLWPLLCRAAPVLRVLLGAGFFCFALSMDVAVPVYLMAAAVGLFGRRGRKRSSCILVSAVVVIAAMTVPAKFTFLLMVGFLGICLLLRGFFWAGRERRYFVACGVLVLLAGPAAWAALGQPLSGFIRYIADASALSSGYTDAMALPTPVTEGRLLALSLGMVLVVLAASCPRPGRWGEIGRVLPVVFFLFAGFLLWKHSLVRSDSGHIFIFPVAMFPALCGWLASRPETRNPKPWIVAVLVMLLGVVGTLYARCRAAGGIGEIANHPMRTVEQLLDLRSARTEAARDVSVERKKAGLRTLGPLIGRAEVDVFGNLQGGAILNGLRYTPRPSFQSYSTYHPRLIDRNEAFYLSKDAPPFVLASLSTLDGRFPALGDAKALLALLENYRPVAFEAPYLLMKENDPPRHKVPMDKRIDIVAAMNEAVAVPAVEDGSGIWAQIEVEVDVRDRVRSLLGKSPPLELVLEGTTGEVGQFRFRLPSAPARSGFLLSPLLATTPDLGLLYTRADDLPKVTSVRVEGGRADKITFSFHAVDLPDPTGTPGATELRSAVLGIPVRAVIGESFFATVKGAEGIVLAAPGAMELERPGHPATLRGEIAVDKWAYKLRDTVGSLRFVVEDEGGAVLWERSLNPAQRAADRERIPFEVDLPGAGGGIVRVRVETEAEGTLRQGFWTALEFIP